MIFWKRRGRVGKRGEWSLVTLWLWDEGKEINSNWMMRISEVRGGVNAKWENNTTYHTWSKSKMEER